MMKNARMLQWLFIATLFLLGTGGYFWYRASAGVTTGKTPVPSEMSASGLVGYWTFDGADYSSATVITDKSGNSHSGTLTNSPTKTTGRWGQALDFPGSNQYVSVGAVYNGVKTVAFWVWADSTTKNIIDLNATATIDVSSGTIRGNNFTSPTIYIDGIVSSTPTIDTTGWHFVAITTGTGINASAVDIGRISTGYFDGRLDDVRMYSSALSASAVYQLYTAGNAKVNAPPEDPLSQSLRGYWKLDTGSGTSAVDSSGNGNTLSMTGSPSWTTGNIGPYALDFSGAAASGGITYLGYTEVSDSDGNQSQSVTVPANTDFALAFISGWRSGTNPSVSSISLGGTAMTSVGSSVSDADGAAYMYYVNTTSGTKTFASTQSNSWTEGGKAVLLYFSGVDQSSPIRSSSAQNATNTATLSFSGMTSQTGDMAVLQMQSYSSVNVDVDLSGQTKIFENAVAFNSEYNAAAYKTATGTTIDLSGSGDYPNGVAAVLKPASYTSAQHLSVASPSSALDFANGASFTITGWFNRDTFANDHTILSTKSGQSTESDGYIAYIDDATDQLIIRFDENGSTDARTFTSTSTFTTTGWHHLALSWNDSAPDSILYVDGKPDGSGSGTAFASMGDLSNTNPFSIGAEIDGDNPFDGKLDDIRIYGYALSADQVKKIYNTTSPTQPIDTSLVGHWTFDGTDIQGTTAIDRSSLGNNGTITGTTKTIGKLGQALSFNGSSDVVNVTGLSLPDWQTASGYTISMWVKDFPDNIQDVVIFEMWNSGDTNERIRLSSNNYVSYQRLQVLVGRQFSSNEGYILDYAYSSVSATTEWHHLVVTANSSRTALFYNGAEVGSDSSITTSGSFTFSNIRIGGGASNYNGGASTTYAGALIDDVRIYNRTLSATEIVNLYSVGK